MNRNPRFASCAAIAASFSLFALAGCSAGAESEDVDHSESAASATPPRTWACTYDWTRADHETFGWDEAATVEEAMALTLNACSEKYETCRAISCRYWSVGWSCEYMGTGTNAVVSVTSITATEARRRATMECGRKLGWTRRACEVTNCEPSP
jgi:hypothetical protein